MGKLTLLLLFLFAAADVSADAPRQRILLDDQWRFHEEPKIITPAGDNTVALTDWLLKESPAGDADAPAMTARDQDVTTGWQPVKAGEDITPTHQDKFVWYRTTLDPVLAAHPIQGPRSLFFVGAGQRAVVYLNGKKIAEHIDNVGSLNASEVLQTGHAAQGAATSYQEVDGVPQCFNVCIEPYLDAHGPNVLTVMIRAASRKGTNGLRGSVILYGGFPPETQPGFNDSAWREVHLPHDYVVEGKFDHLYNNQRAALPVPRAYYRRELAIPTDFQGKSLWLDFDGIYRDSCVWLNGYYLGNHPSGYTGSCYDIDRLVKFGEVNTLVVMVDPRVAEGWWCEGGGIYRHVWLNAADRLHVAPLGTFITTNVKDVTGEHPSADLTIETRVLNEGTEAQTATLVSTILDAQDKEVGKAETPLVLPPGAEATFTQSASIADAHLWSCETPTLYRVATEIVRDGIVRDTYRTTVGIRTVRFDADRGLLLNEKPVKIYGTCNHHDFAGIGIAMPDNLQEWRIRKLQEFGSNAWRCSHSDDPKKNPPYLISNYSTWFAFDKSQANENITHWKPVADRAWISGGFYWTGFDYKGEPSPSLWPAIASHYGIFDLCGFPKDNYYYYKAEWTKPPIVHLMPHWNWAGTKEGQSMRVVVFGNTPQVELFLNDQSLGSHDVPPNESVEWQVPYQPGRLEARGVSEGKVVASDVVETTGAPAALMLRSDMKSLGANGEDIAVAEVSVVDARGRVVPTAGDLVQFTLQGPGTLAGVGNGDPAGHEPDADTRRHAFNGHCAALLRAGGQPGKLSLIADAPGLSSAHLEVEIDR